MTSQNAFVQAIHNILNKPEERQQTAAWHNILETLSTLNTAQIDESSTQVFALFVQHINANYLQSEGRLVPEHILFQFSQTYRWEEHKDTLAQLHSDSEISCVLNYASLSQNIDQVNEPLVETKSNKHPIRRNIMLAIAVLGIYWVYQGTQSPEHPPVTEEVVIEFDERTLACNNVYSAEPTEDFETCLSLAKAGNIEAQKRLVWAYSRSGEFLDWQQVYNWLKVTQRYDRNAIILSFAVMHYMGNTEELKESGERGIIRMANQNHATANILLASMYALETNILPKSSNPLWLLERAYDRKPELLPPIEMASILVNGYFSTPEISKAKVVLANAAEKYFPNGTNNVAWFLATLDNNPITDSSYPVSLAKSVVDDPEFANRHTYIDTLAATYAANNQFDLAVKTQQEAIARIAELNVSEENKQQLVDEFTSRLNQYKQGKAVVESSLLQDKSEFFTRLQKNTLNRLLNGFYKKIEVPEGAEAN